MSNQVKVKQQTEVGSKNWGVYVDGKLVEGGFFTKADAQACAEGWRRYLLHAEGLRKELQASAGN